MSTRRGILGCLRIASFVSLLLVVASPAFAIGPVPVSALPAGGSVTDSDNGNGQAWGRAGGRTLTFTINDLTQFSTLTYGVVAGTNPTLAFDNAIDAPGETMTFGSASNGVARWTGSAVLQVVDPAGTVTVPTRFTLTITDANNVPLGIFFENGGVSPGASVIATSTFKVNELFEMNWNGAWYPVLDKYDSLNTIPGSPPASNSGPVITGVQTGFYYAGAGISLQDHDTNMNTQLGSIKGDTSFIRADTAMRLQNIAGDLGDVRTAVDYNLAPNMLLVQQAMGQVQMNVGQIQQNLGPLSQTVGQVQGIVGRVDQNVSALQQSVSQLVNSGSGNIATKSDIQGLQDTFLILWGLEPCPASAGPVCASAKFVQSLSTQASVDAVSGGVGAVQTSVNALQGNISALQSKIDALAGIVADAPLQLSVAQIASPGNTMRWIVTMSRDGTLVPGTLQGIIAVLTTGSPSTASDVLSRATVTQVSPGVLDVSLSVVKSVTDGSAFVFKAKATDATGSSDATALVVPK